MCDGPSSNVNEVATGAAAEVLPLELVQGFEKRLERIIVTFSSHERPASRLRPSRLAVHCRCFHPIRQITPEMDHSRDPCPWVILNDFGGAFAMGVRVHAHLDNKH
jgi:hypothetical protein